MIKQLFKIIWNRKSHNIFLMTEIFISCIVIFVLSGVIVHNLGNYFIPIGFEYRGLLNLSVYWTELPEGKNDEKKLLAERYNNICKELEGMDEIMSISWSSFNLPYSGNTITGDVHCGRRTAYSNSFAVDDNYLKTAGLKLLKGRWFNAGDNIPGKGPVVISQDLEEKLFGTAGAIGKRLGNDGEGNMIIGVTARYRYNGEYTDDNECVFYRRSLADTAADMDGCYLIRLRPGSSIMTEDKIEKKIKAMYPDANVSIDNTAELRENKLRPLTFDTVMAGFLGGFLVLNVSLGLFGILWQNINRRKREIGLRKALGASSRMICLQIVGEVLALTTVSIMLGVVFEAQIAILNPFDSKTIIYILGIFISVIFIYLVTVLCSVYPARMASGIEAAAALHDE